MFEHFVLVNLEQYPEFKEAFQTLDPIKIIAKIELLTNTTIHPGKTLLFIDEIQECPQAIMALRYFKEQMPALHVIGAGSLLEFALEDENFRMPVGRVEFMQLRPLSFGEYLDVSGNEKLRKFLQNIHFSEKIDEVIHKRLLLIVREYMSIGGMPAVVAEYLNTKSFVSCQEVQSNLLASYRKDFGKYVHRTQYANIEKVFNKAPGLVGQWLKYSQIDPDTSARSLKNALEKLYKAGIFIPIYSTSDAGLPLNTYLNEKRCKLLFLDIGLMKRACKIDLQLHFIENLILNNLCPLAEQFVGQELVAYEKREEVDCLFFWIRETKNSAEVDYLTTVGSHIIPIEVKAGAIGALRSLKRLMEEKNIRLGVRISEVPLGLYENVLSIPFYLISELSRLVTEAYENLGG